MINIARIQQLDNHTFEIEWNDAMVQSFRLSYLQRRCPCAQCIDEKTGERATNASPVDDTVRALRVNSVGRYALQIHYTTGCSTGIYTFEFLRNLK